MDIATIIITSLTLIAVGVGLFLNHKTNLKLVGQLKDFEEKTNQSISATRAEILEIVKVHREDTLKHFDNSTLEIKNLVNEKTEQINLEVATRIDNLGKIIISNIASTKTDIIDTFENKSTKTKEDIQNSNAKLQKETADTIEVRLKGFQSEIQSTLEKIKVEFETNSTSINKAALKTETEIKNKIDSALKTQEEQQFEALANMEDKFQKVINEIKSPLALD